MTFALLALILSAALLGTICRIACAPEDNESGQPWADPDLERMLDDDDDSKNCMGPFHF